MRRTTEMPSSALAPVVEELDDDLGLGTVAERDAARIVDLLGPALSAASLLMPNMRTTPDLAPKPVIFTVRSCASALPGTASRANASAAERADVLANDMASLLRIACYWRRLLFAMNVRLAGDQPLLALQLMGQPLPDKHERQSEPFWVVLSPPGSGVARRPPGAVVHVFQQPSMDLAGRRDRHVGDELHRAGQLVGGQMAATMLDQLLAGGGGARLQHDVGLRQFALASSATPQTAPALLRGACTAPAPARPVNIVAGGEDHVLLAVDDGYE